MRFYSLTYLVSKLLNVHPKCSDQAKFWVPASIPLRKDLASIMCFILSLLIFGGQNLHDRVQTLMLNLCMTSKRWQDDEWRPEFEARARGQTAFKYWFWELSSQISKLCCPPFGLFNKILSNVNRHCSLFFFQRMACLKTLHF